MALCLVLNDDGWAAGEKRGNIFHIPKNVGRQQHMREMESRSVEERRALDDSTGSKSESPLVSLSLYPAFNRSGDNLVGWLVGSFVHCGGGSSWPESELRVTTELPGNTVSNDNENDNDYERHGVLGDSKQLLRPPRAPLPFGARGADD